MCPGANREVYKRADVVPGVLESQDKQMESKTSLQSKSVQWWKKNSRFQENNGKTPSTPDSPGVDISKAADWTGKA